MLFLYHISKKNQDIFVRFVVKIRFFSVFYMVFFQQIGAKTGYPSRSLLALRVKVELREGNSAKRLVNSLVKEILRDPYVGTGKPEPLKGNLAGFWSRRIDEKNRLVYRIVGDDCLIAQCRSHYDGK